MSNKFFIYSEPINRQEASNKYAGDTIRTIKYFITIVVFLLAAQALFISCRNVTNNASAKNFDYQNFKDSIKFEKQYTPADSINIFDSKLFTPGIDSLDSLLIKMDTLWQQEAALMEQVDTFITNLKSGVKFTDEEKQILKDNVKQVDSFLINRNNIIPASCTGKDCFIYIEINKPAQLLYLYIYGQLKDSFPVSTGIKKYETPNLNLKPSGPLLTKYNSKKFPGGNYQGLGNMPYAIFLRGGYAIHGTTVGNFPKLGTKASHGCIRLHPENARILFELIKIFGLSHTWVTITEEALLSKNP